MKNKNFTSWIKNKPCFKCAGIDSDPHHLKTRLSERAKMLFTRRSRDERGLVPLCRRCHTWVHDHPAWEAAFQERLWDEADKLWEEFDNSENRK